MRALVLVIVLFPLITHASAFAEGSPRDALLEYTQAARDAAIAGNCDAARELAAKVRSLDEAYYVTVFADEEAITKCVPALVSLRGSTIDRVPALEARRPTGKPPLDGGRIVGQVLLGAIGEGVGGGVGLLLGIGTGSLGGIVLLTEVGGTLMGSVAVYAAGTSGNQTGSFGWTWFGALSGAVVAAIPAGTIGKNHGEVALGIVIAGPMIGALLGFNATRHWRDDKPSVGVGSLIQLERGKASLGIPLVTRAEVRGATTTHVPLLGGSF